MSVGFGFSAGDFIAAIELVGTVVDALRSSGEAGAEYRELVAQLLSLETALLQVKNLEFEESQYAQVVALRQAAAQCKRTIDDFWHKTKKYQGSLGNSNGSGTTARDSWRKVKWALFKKDDISRFKIDLMGHTQSILLLLATIQRNTSRIQSQQQNLRSKSLVAEIQKGFFRCMRQLAVVLNQGKTLIATTAHILSINLQVFQVVLQIQDIVTRIPYQVERQQPVFLIDALGRHTPFHLEFIRSAEAFVSVLGINFHKYGTASEKIHRREFAIQDTATLRDIDLDGDWDLCFQPGQNVNMSMVFYNHRRMWDRDQRCPKCDTLGPTSLAQEFIKCKTCSMLFRREIREFPGPVELGSAPKGPNLLADSGESPRMEGPRDSLVQRPSSSIRPDRQDLEQQTIALFQRVRVYETGFTPKTETFENYETFSSTSDSEFLERDYTLPCEFASICGVKFSSQEFEDWLSHSLTHFGRGGPPLKTVCTFCDQEFDCSGEPALAAHYWRRRMEHVSSHFQNTLDHYHTKPDFWTIEHLYRVGGMKQEDYNYLVKYSERPRLENLYPFTYAPLEVLMKKDRELRAVYDMRKEERRRRELRPKEMKRLTRSTHFQPKMSPENRPPSDEVSFGLGIRDDLFSHVWGLRKGPEWGSGS